MCTVLLPPGDNANAVNKYINNDFIVGVEPAVCSETLASIDYPT